MSMQLLSMQEAAKRLGVTFWAVARWARQGLLPSVKIGRRRLFDEVELETFVQRFRKSAQHDEMALPEDEGKKGNTSVRG